MELQVFSDPLWGLGSEAGVSMDRLDDVRRYDEEIVKPALFLADRVVLRSWRLDMQFEQRLKASAVRLGVPLQATIRWMVYGAADGARERVGIDKQLHRDLQLVLDLYGGAAGEPLGSAEFFESDAVAEFARRWVAFHRTQHEALRSQALVSLGEKGVLEECPWDSRDTARQSYPQATWNHDNSSFNYGWKEMVTAAQCGESGVLLDQGIDSRLAETDAQVRQPSTVTLENATNLMRLIDGLSAAPMDEIVDLRQELSSYLRPFRSFILSHAEGVNVTPDMSLEERRRQAELLWEREVSPAIEELRQKVESESFIRNVKRITAQGQEAAIGLGLGLTTALASGAIGITALAGLGVAALPTIVKAAAASGEARRENQRGGAYFVLEIERRLRARNS